MKFQPIGENKTKSRFVVYIACKQFRISSTWKKHPRNERLMIVNIPTGWLFSFLRPSILIACWILKRWGWDGWGECFGGDFFGWVEDGLV